MIKCLCNIVKLNDLRRKAVLVILYKFLHILRNGDIVAKKLDIIKEIRYVLHILL